MCHPYYTQQHLNVQVYLPLSVPGVLLRHGFRTRTTLSKPSFSLHLAIHLKVVQLEFSALTETRSKADKVEPCYG